MHGPDQPSHRLLQLFLADRDIPCPGCGYNLRGLTTDRCPECNQPLSLRVGLTEPRLGPWLAAISGALSGAGACLVCLALVVILTFRWGPPRGRDLFAVVVLPMIGLATQGIAAALLLRPKGRTWFRTISGAARGRVIAGCWLLPLVFVVWFALSVR